MLFSLKTTSKTDSSFIEGFLHIIRLKKLTRIQRLKRLKRQKWEKKTTTISVCVSLPNEAVSGLDFFSAQVDTFHLIKSGRRINPKAH